MVEAERAVLDNEIDNTIWMGYDRRIVLYLEAISIDFLESGNFLDLTLNETLAFKTN